MGDGSTNLFGIVIPSTNPVFLTVVGVHILLGLACTVTGAAAMLSQKRRGRHPRYGTIYYWCLAGVFLTAASLAAVRWADRSNACCGECSSASLACRCWELHLPSADFSSPTLALTSL